MSRLLSLVTGLVLGLLPTGAFAMQTETHEVELDAHGWTLPATVEWPAEVESPAACVVLVAGSGPTDRNWESRLIPGDNGSGGQLGRELAARGIATIRYDKLGSAGRMEGLERLSLDHYRDEIGVAAGALRQRGCRRVFVLGNSEGSLHAFRFAQAAQGEGWWGGVISLAGPSRRMVTLAMEQYRGQMPNATLEQLGELADFEERMLALPAGADQPVSFSVPGLEMLWNQALSPTQGRVVTELMQADPLESVRAYRGRALILSADRDIQVPVADGAALFAALPAEEGSRYAVIEQANHVFKFEDRPIETGPMLALAYSEAGRPLAEGLVDLLVEWIAVE